MRRNSAWAESEGERTVLERRGGPQGHSSLVSKTKAEGAIEDGVPAVIGDLGRSSLVERWGGRQRGLGGHGGSGRGQLFLAA